MSRPPSSPRGLVVREVAADCRLVQPRRPVSSREGGRPPIARRQSDPQGWAIRAGDARHAVIGHPTEIEHEGLHTSPAPRPKLACTPRWAAAAARRPFVKQKPRSAPGEAWRFSQCFVRSCSCDSDHTIHGASRTGRRLCRTINTGPSTQQIGVEHDPDDPPPPNSEFRHFLNRCAEETLSFLRLFGFI